MTPSTHDCRHAMSNVRLSLACWNYDRARASGRQREGGRHRPRVPRHAGRGDVLSHVAKREFDVAELSLSSYTVSLFSDPKPFIAIPVWPSRSFRHCCEQGLSKERLAPQALFAPETMEAFEI